MAMVGTKKKKKENCQKLFTYMTWVFTDLNFAVIFVNHIKSRNAGIFQHTSICTRK